MNEFDICNGQIVLKTVILDSYDQYTDYISKIEEINHENILKPTVMYCEGNNMLIAIPTINTLEEQLIVPYSEELSGSYDAMMEGIYRGLDFLHSQNIIYGILTPETLLLRKDDGKILFPYVYYYIIDKSFYKLDSYYKIMYASPNRLKNGEYEKSDDIWSLGCILYYLYSNIQPFYNENVTTMINNIFSCNYKSIKNKEKVPEIIKIIISLCLIQDKDKRINVSRLLYEYNNKYLPVECDVPAPNISNNIDYVRLYFMEERINNRREIILLISKSDSNILKVIGLYNREKRDEYFRLLLEVMLSDYNKREFIIERTHFGEIESFIINCLFKKHNNLIAFDKNINKYIDQSSFASKLFSVLSIRQIGFSNCELNDEQMIYISEIISHLPFLDTLSIWNNRITSIGLKVICEEFKYLSNLITIDVSSNQLGDFGIEILSKYISNCIYLKVLNVGMTGMTNKSFSSLCNSISSLKQISNLSLFNNEIGKEGISSLTSIISNFTKLTDLKLNSNRISDDGLNKLSQCFSYITNLKLLWLHNNEITVKSIFIFSNSFTVLKNLNQLSLANNQINDAGIKALSKSLIYMTKLEELYLAFNHIRYQGLNDLGKSVSCLKSLKKLTLEGNQISKAEKDDFLKKHGLVDK